MSHLARLAALVAATTLATTGLVSGLTTPATAATADPRPVSIGASWLQAQLTSGLIHNTQYDFDDIGLTIDAGLSLDTIGGHPATVSTITSALAPRIAGPNGYVEADEYDFAPPYALVQRGHYAGPTAKALVYAEATAQDTSSWGGTDLVTALENRVTATGPATGRIADDSSYGDYANTIGQAFAARGLSAVSSSKATDVIDFLVEQQCSAGFFRLNFTQDATASDQTCEGGVTAGDSTPDTDATAMAVLQLHAITSPSAAVTGAITNAEAWLLAAQHADGSFGGGASTEAANTNSTGLAGWALGELGNDAAAGKAATWVRAHQADNAAACPDALSGQTGTIGYDDAGVAAGRKDGITTKAQDQWRRSTAPTLPVLRWAPAATSPLTLTGPAGFVRAGTTATYHLSGVAPGATACVSGIGASRPVSPGATGVAALDLTLPAGTADRVAAATSGAAEARATVSALDSSTFTVRPAHRIVHRRARLHVVVRGLVPGESVTLRLRGVTVRAGKANGNGRFVADVRMGRRLGKARIVASGEFPTIRHGRAVVRVVR